MHALIGSAGFCLLTVAAGLQAQTLDTRIGPISKDGELGAHSSLTLCIYKE